MAKQANQPEQAERTVCDAFTLIVKRTPVGTKIDYDVTFDAFDAADHTKRFGVPECATKKQIEANAALIRDILHIVAQNLTAGQFNVEADANGVIRAVCNIP